MPTNRVPLVCTLEELVRAVWEIAECRDSNVPIALVCQAAEVQALFRPAEEPAPAPAVAPPEPRYPCVRCGMLRTKAEGGTAFTVCDDCWDAPAPPPAGEPGKRLQAYRDKATTRLYNATRMVDALPASPECTLAVEELALTKEAVHDILDERDALRAENERLKGEIVERQRAAYVQGRRDGNAGRITNENLRKPEQAVVESWYQAARNYYPSVPPGENRSEG